MTSHKVELYIYDLSMGMAASISPMLLGKKIDGIWHTSIVVYDREYFFGSHGVESCNPGTTALGPPKEKKVLGETQVPYSVFVDYLAGLSTSTYSAKTYDLFHHNCNNFTEEIAQFLCGASIPKSILDLPSEVLSSSLGPAIPALVAQLEKSARPIEEEQGRVHDREPSPDFSKEIEEARSDTKVNGVEKNINGVDDKNNGKDVNNGVDKGDSKLSNGVENQGNSEN